MATMSKNELDSLIEGILNEQVGVDGITKLSNAEDAVKAIVHNTVMTGAEYANDVAREFLGQKSSMQLHRMIFTDEWQNQFIQHVRSQVMNYLRSK